MTSSRFRDPSDENARHVLEAITIRPKQPLICTIACGYVEGMYTHYCATTKRTCECLADEPLAIDAWKQCPLCQWQVATWRGFLVIISEDQRRHGLLRVSQNCRQEIISSGCVNGKLVGVRGMFFRVGERINSPMSFQYYNTRDKVNGWSREDHQRAVSTLLGCRKEKKISNAVKSE